jgi:hypothetical protein
VLLFAVLAGACSAATPALEVRIDAPFQAKLDTTPFQRVLVAGFLVGGSDDVDINEETVRLLRSQLRQNGAWAVIDAAPLPLTDVVIRRTGQKDTAIRNETDLDSYEALFSNADYWRQIGEEFQSPLIVTGTVLFRPHSAPVVRDPSAATAGSAPQRSKPLTNYQVLSGYLMQQRVVFIDGRTGARLHTEPLRLAIVYDPQETTLPLAAYFELMDRLAPRVLDTIVTRKVPAVRALLK